MQLLGGGLRGDVVTEEGGLALLLPHLAGWRRRGHNPLPRPLAWRARRAEAGRPLPRPDLPPGQQLPELGRRAAPATSAAVATTPSLTLAPDLDPAEREAAAAVAGRCGGGGEGLRETGRGEGERAAAVEPCTAAADHHSHQTLGPAGASARSRI
ncbi:unnamed protein product [Urochloa humidicola]